VAFQPNPLVFLAIDRRRLAPFIYHDKNASWNRMIMACAKARFNFLDYQLRGASSRRLPDWLTVKVDEMNDLSLLDETFPGGRDVFWQAYPVGRTVH
jgi:hypothetical protein